MVGHKVPDSAIDLSRPLSYGVQGSLDGRLFES